MKKLILISIILLMLTVGAVSAEDNATVDNEQIETEITDVGENALKETYDIQVDEYIEALPAQNQHIDIDNYPKDAEGNISLSIDGVEHNLLKGYYYNYYDLNEMFVESDIRYSFNATNLTFGLHNYTLNFSGDDKYSPSTKSGILNITSMIFDFPSYITLRGNSYKYIEDFILSYDNTDIEIKYLKGMEGNLYLYIYGVEKIINLTDLNATEYCDTFYDSIPYRLIRLDKSGEFYVYRESIFFNRPTNLTVKYASDSLNISRSYFINVTYNMDCDDEIMKGENLQIFIPKSISSKITVKIDGKKVKFYSVSKEYDYTYIYFYAKASSLDPGNHKVTIYFKGDMNCPARSITKTFTVVHQPTTSPKTVKLYYMDSATSSLTIYGTDGKTVDAGYETDLWTWTNHDEDTWSKLTKTKTKKNGKITFKIPKNLKPGNYELRVYIYSLDIDIKVKLVVKHLVTLKTVKIKKSAKKLVLTATLKNNKPIQGKTLTFKFNGKTYKAKTNSKGIAKATVPKSVLKNLKVGKTVTYQATYLKDTVKKTAKVLK